MVSVNNAGTDSGNAPSYLIGLSAEGRYVAFHSTAPDLVPGDSNGATDVFVHDRQTDAIERVSLTQDGLEGNGDSRRPFISADGRYTAFQSEASNLVPADTNGVYDVFVRDRWTGEIRRESVEPDPCFIHLTTR